MKKSIMIFTIKSKNQFYRLKHKLVYSNLIDQNKSNN